MRRWLSWIEHQTTNLGVGGSNPPRCAINLKDLRESLEEHSAPRMFRGFSRARSLAATAWPSLRRCEPVGSRRWQPPHLAAGGRRGGRSSTRRGPSSRPGGRVWIGPARRSRLLGGASGPCSAQGGACSTLLPLFRDLRPDRAAGAPRSRMAVMSAASARVRKAGPDRGLRARVLPRSAAAPYQSDQRSDRMPFMNIACRYCRFDPFQAPATALNGKR